MVALGEEGNRRKKGEVAAERRKEGRRLGVGEWGAWPLLYRGREKVRRGCGGGKATGKVARGDGAGDIT